MAIMWGWGDMTILSAVITVLLLCQPLIGVARNAEHHSDRQRDGRHSPTLQIQVGERGVQATFDAGRRSSVNRSDHHERHQNRRHQEHRQQIIYFEDYYPKVYYVCYEKDQVNEHRIHIRCPYPPAWYSTAPGYYSEQYQSNFRPEYICPRNGAAQFRVFATGYEATSWSSRYCNQWIYTKNNPVLEGF